MPEETMFERLLVSNRGEIAVRILRAASELGIATVAIHPEDDAGSLHVRRADESRVLEGRGARAYLDAEQIVAVAKDAGCDAIHPGYGFLSENAGFASRCTDAGLVFVGPRTEHLEIFGDKPAARQLAQKQGVPVIEGTDEATTLEQAQSFLKGLGPGRAVMLKAVAGGGGRGMRAVRTAEELEAVFERCAFEANSAFGDGALYVERLVTDARHIEVQIAGDSGGEVIALGERECSLQRRHQKLVEVAPSPGLAPNLRSELLHAAVTLAKAIGYESLGTVEFLVDHDGGFAFIEANARLQVEHTVSEEVTGVDLVHLQLQLAAGKSLRETGLDPANPPEARGHAIQLRINTETLTKTGQVRPSGGRIAVYEPPSGPGVRIDTAAYTGYATSPHYDSLLAKLVIYSPSSRFEDVLQRADRALSELRIEGVETNAAFLRSLIRHPDVRGDRIHTGFVEAHVDEVVEGAREFASAAVVEPAARARAGAEIDANDPLAVLDHGKSDAASNEAPPAGIDPSEGAMVRAPLQGTVVSVDVREGQDVHAGAGLLVLEAMKMEHVVEAPVSGVVRRVGVTPGDTVYEGHPLVSIEEADVASRVESREDLIDLDAIRPDLAEVYERHAYGQDRSRPDAVARRRKTAQRTARENVEDLCDPGSLVEYGPLVIAAQRRRRSLDDLIERTPADGMIAAVGRVNGDFFGERRSRCVVMSYDYTVLAGTQGMQNHRKKDRMFEIAEQQRLPVVFFTEGGGGRPGDTDGSGVAGLDCRAFQFFGRLSGLVPLVGINSGRCFAGNAALLGCCDVVIATENSNIGMGGPAMIEGGGLGVFRPEEVGPMDVQTRNGVVDLAVEDEEEAVRVAKQYLAYFQGTVPAWECADQRRLRQAIPENRLRIYDVRAVIETLADTGSVLELRQHFGLGMVTALARVEGRPLGVVANNPVHLAGAIDSDGADKAARFMQLCDAFDIPILFLCDTPGIMVGPEVEKTGLVRHASRLFVTGGSLSVPFFTIVLRKGYGLGAQAMAGGSFHAPVFTVSWPTGEFGGMGLEGAVKLGYRKELAAEEDPEKRRALYQEMVDRMYEHGKAVNMASHFEIDEVIDPTDSRRWILSALESAPPSLPRTGKKRPCIDTW
ncbi:MAG: carboxyl transferase domain-containing protein [Myxococcota bacterium]|nr:carboxyl transferase domain-containing protein [Myxococcota bacterium]